MINKPLIAVVNYPKFDRSVVDVSAFAGVPEVESEYLVCESDYVTECGRYQLSDDKRNWIMTGDPMPLRTKVRMDIILVMRKAARAL